MPAAMGCVEMPFGNFKASQITLLLIVGTFRLGRPGPGRAHLFTFTEIFMTFSNARFTRRQGLAGLAAALSAPTG